MLIITFFASIQFVFLAGVPEDVTNFAFMFITNAVGFVMLFILFFSELFRLDAKHIKCCLILTLANSAFNFFLLLGSSGLSSTTTSCVLTLYFVFIPIIEFFWFKTKPKLNTIVAMVIVALGIFFILECDASILLRKNMLFMMLADISFAFYIVITGKYATDSSPSLIAIGQLFFNMCLALICWFVESRLTGKPMHLTSDLRFWGSVIFISFFIRSMYTVVQIYAQRYVSALNTSLIFSMAIVMTMVFSPIVSKIFQMGNSEENISTYKVIGSILMVIGVLIADGAIFPLFKKKAKVEIKK